MKILEIVSFHKQQKMLWLTTVNRTFNKGTLQKCQDLGWEEGGEDDVEKVGRTSGKSWLRTC